MALSLLRVIAGVAKGRRLKAPTGLTTRPATDRLKEAVFSSLGPRVVDAEVLDLYAGSGALGIEALSRGASHATFIEKDEAAATIIAANLNHTQLSESATVLRMKAEHFAARPADRIFQLIFIDPPYALGFPIEVLESLVALGHVDPGAVIVVETSARTAPLDSGGFAASGAPGSVPRAAATPPAPQFDSGGFAASGAPKSYRRAAATPPAPPFDIPAGFVLTGQRRYADSVVAYLKFEGRS